jgi:hypothetical protein
MANKGANMSVSAKDKPPRKTAAKPAEPAVTEGSPVAEPQSAFERAIILRAVSMTTGSIATNWEQVLAAVEAKSKEYQDIARYAGDEKQAREDRALLRKQKDLTKTTIASIKEAWDEPLKLFLAGGKQIEKQFDYAIVAIDTWVKEGEAREKEKKRQDIQAYFDGKGFDLVPLDMFFDDRWLNKGYKLPDIKKEIDGKITEIYSNIKILESISDHGTIAKAMYLKTLDMGAALSEVQTLKDNAERLAREQANRETRHAQDMVSQNAAAERREEQAAAREGHIENLVNDAMDIEEPAVPAGPKIIEYTLQFKGTKDQLLKLREYMTSQGIPYDKLMLFDNAEQAAQYVWEEDIRIDQIYSAIFVPID